MRLWLVLPFLLMTVSDHIVFGQRTESLDSLEGVGVDEKLNADLPLDLKFRDSTGKSLALADLFVAERPVILSLNYSDCPMLCQLQLNGLVDGLRDLTWNAGVEYDVVSVSIDPLETAQRARQTKQRYVKAYGRPKAAAGWRFLTGDKRAIESLSDSVGFRFRYVPERKEYAHAAAIIICTPEGRVSRYLYGVLYPPQTLKLSLVEAGEGKVGSTLDRVLLFCFHYDATSGKYAPVARQILKFAAGITLTAIIIGLIPAWARKRHNSVAGTIHTRGTVHGGAI